MESSISSLLNHLEASKDNPSVSLAYASIGDDGCTEVARFIRDNVFIQNLDLRGNNLGAHGAVALANGIKLNRSLRSLNLKWNAIGKDNTGIQALCDVMKTNAGITHFDLRNNKINGQGAKHVADFIRQNCTVTHIDLSWSDLGVDGGLTLLEALKQNSTIIDCQLSGSKVGESTLHEVAFVLRRNRASAAYRGAPEAQATGGGGAAPAVVPTSQVSSLTQAAAMPGGREMKYEKQGTKDEGSLMLRLMMKEREQVVPDDKRFYQEVAEYIDKLQVEVTRHKQARIDAEERERLGTGGFVDREMRYSKEIRTLEENLQRNMAEKERLQKEIILETAELKRLTDENAMAIRESVAVQEHCKGQEGTLRTELRDIMVEKRRIQDVLANERKDVELNEQENQRLCAHVRAFQRDVNEILVQ